MSRSPRVTGAELITALGRPGFPFSASKAVIISCATRMAAARLYRCIQAKPSALGCFTKSLEIAKSPPTDSENCCIIDRSP